MTNDILARRKRELDERRRQLEMIKSEELRTHNKVLDSTTGETREQIEARIAELEAEIGEN